MVAAACFQCGTPFTNPAENFCPKCGTQKAGVPTAPVVGAAPQTTFVVHVTNGPVQQAGTDAYGYFNPQSSSWRSGICDCFQFPVPNCLMTYFLPCITFSQINARLGLRTYQQSLLISFGAWVGLIIGAGMWGARSCDYEVRTSIVSGGTVYRSYGNCDYNVVNFIGLALYWLGLIAVLVVLTLQRGAVRTVLGLPGSSFEDCLYSWCCGCCSLSQLATQAGSFKPGSCEFNSPPASGSVVGASQPAYTAAASPTPVAPSAPTVSSQV